MNPQDLRIELQNLKTLYSNGLESLKSRANDAINKAVFGRYSDHDPFNMSATCQELAVIAGKIAQTENVIRWMDGK
jgi:hypothetical protein